MHCQLLKIIRTCWHSRIHVSPVALFLLFKLFLKHSADMLIIVRFLNWTAHFQRKTRVLGRPHKMPCAWFLHHSLNMLCLAHYALLLPHSEKEPELYRFFRTSCYSPIGVRCHAVFAVCLEIGHISFFEKPYLELQKAPFQKEKATGQALENACPVPFSGVLDNSI